MFPSSTHSKLNMFPFTCTVLAISCIRMDAGTDVGPICVNAGGMFVTVWSNCTFINICKQIISRTVLSIYLKSCYIPNFWPFQPRMPTSLLKSSFHLCKEEVIMELLTHSQGLKVMPHFHFLQLDMLGLETSIQGLVRSQWEGKN